MPGAAWQPALAQGLGAGLLLEPAVDPLGFGQIDHRTLTLAPKGAGGSRLTRGPRGMGKPGRASRMTKPLEGGGRSSILGGDAALDAAAALADAAPSSAAAAEAAAEAEDDFGLAAPPGGDLGALRPLVNLGAREFCPETYLAQVHRGISRRELRQGLTNLEVALSERTGQLRDLVKENFDRFISCKNTIDDIQLRLQDTEAAVGAGGAGSGAGARGSQGGLGAASRPEGGSGGLATQLGASLGRLEASAARVFGPLLERQKQVEEIKSALALMHRHRHVFEVPARMRACAEGGEWEQVLTEYRKVQAAVGPPGAPRSFVLGRVEEEARAAVRQLERGLRDTLQLEAPPPPEAVVRAIKVLQRVEADALVSPRRPPSDYVAFYLASRRDHARRRLAELRRGFQDARRRRPAAGAQEPPDAPQARRGPDDAEVREAMDFALAQFPDSDAASSPPAAGREGLGGRSPAVAFVEDFSKHFGDQVEALWALFGPHGALTDVERPASPASAEASGVAAADELAGGNDVQSVLLELHGLLQSALDAAFADLRGASRPWNEVGEAVLAVVRLQSRARALPRALPTEFLRALGSSVKRALKSALSQVKEDLTLFAALLVESDDSGPRQSHVDGPAPVSSPTPVLQLQTTALPSRAERLIRAAAAFSGLFSAPEREPVARAVQASLGLFITEIAQTTARRVAAPDCCGPALLLHAGNMIHLAEAVLPRADHVWLRPPSAAAPQGGGGGGLGDLTRLSSGALEDARRQACSRYARERAAQQLLELLEVASAEALARRTAQAPPEAVRGTVLEALHSVVELHAEVHLHAPPCLELVLPVVVEARWNQLAEALRGAAGALASEGGLPPGDVQMQLLLELSFLEAALAEAMTPAARETCRSLKAPLLAAGAAPADLSGILQRELDRTRLNWLALRAL